MKKKKLPSEIEITELFLVKAGNDYNRTFIGQIYRETAKEGKSIVRGSIQVTDGKLWSTAETQEELGNYLDDLCSMKLDYGLHNNEGVNINIIGLSYHLN